MKAGNGAAKVASYAGLTGRSAEENAVLVAISMSEKWQKIKDKRAAAGQVGRAGKHRSAEICDAH